jgi:hypothetical protein
MFPVFYPLWDKAVCIAGKEHSWNLILRLNQTPRGHSTQVFHPAMECNPSPMEGDPISHVCFLQALQPSKYWSSELHIRAHLDLPQYQVSEAPESHEVVSFLHLTNRKALRGKRLDQVPVKIQSWPGSSDTRALTHSEATHNLPSTLMLFDL